MTSKGSFQPKAFYDSMILRFYENSTKVEQCLCSLQELSELGTVYFIRNTYELVTFHAIDFPVPKVISGVVLCEIWFYNSANFC